MVKLWLRLLFLNVMNELVTNNVNNLVKKIAITSLLICSLLGCSVKQELTPEWSIMVSEESQLSTVKSKLYLIDSNKTFGIDLQSGMKRETIKKVVRGKILGIGTTDKENNLKQWKSANGTTTYSLIESFSPVGDDCQSPLHKYWLERDDEDKATTIYRLGKYERMYVLDFQIMDNSLFIIKTPVNSGDAFVLERYNLNK